MILYAMKCGDGHAFDSWFPSAAGYDRLAQAGLLACAICGSDRVQKSLMAPALQGEAGDGAPPPALAKSPARPLSLPTNELEQTIATLRRKIEENSTYVGANFATEARAIHDGDAPERSIWGEVRPDEAQALIEDGVPVAPLPFMPSRKAN